MSQSNSLKKEIDASVANKLLIICVDRDNDIGEKTGISTPVIGRDACIEAAQRLALEDPEDADSNSIFFAIKTYEDLVSKGYQAEVISVAGVENRGVQADEKIIREVKQAMEQFTANGAVIVSDGEDDESVIPIIQTVVPIVSVQRVVMKVSRSVEYSYAVFGKYLKMIAYDSKYSKFFLGVPGILLLIGGIGAIFNITAEISAVLISILGGAFLIRAFDVDKAWTSWAKPTPDGFIRLFTMVTGIVLILAAVPAGITTVEPSVIESEFKFAEIISDKVIMGYFVSGMLPFLWMGLGTIFGGMLFSNWFNRKQRQISDALRIIVLISIYPTIAQFTAIMTDGESSYTLIPPLVAGFAITLISATLLFRRYRKKKGDEPLQE